MKSKTVKERKALEEMLIWGDIARIARLAEVNRKTVERWFNGDNNNHKVAAYAKAVIEKRNETIESKIAEL
ncbi:hypothetical protein EI546_06385 [Aequorivita sp. H23M31]|uniref:XRE family transcriptional regulator n=1 Tax=Aequorivita ciconiae TaxID=2494375 RepID=A0A410G262_9FLAO|nr:hypothetical protein [Aequorivita sp. H23M31]QAA81377.1 hypothetical protein EI546_06385 [Aequorivita sp. H23M31]